MYYSVNFPYIKTNPNAPNWLYQQQQQQQQHNNGVRVAMMLFHGGGKRARTPQKMGLEKLALTNNMAAGIRTLLAVSATGTLSNDPSPSQLLCLRPARPPPVPRVIVRNAEKRIHMSHERIITTTKTAHRLVYVL